MRASDSGSGADCHGASTTTSVRPVSAPIVLIGNPNVGKSTLFNAITGSRQRTVNAPGTTVQLEVGRWSIGAGAGVDGVVELADLPGTYSLLARSPDEVVSADAVFGDGGPGGRPELGVLVADASALSRSLYLVAQAASTGMPIVVALTMSDVAASRGVGTHADRLAAVLGVPVVAVDGRTGTGVRELARVVGQVLAMDDAARPRVEGVDRIEGSTREEWEAGSLAQAEKMFSWVVSVEERAGVEVAARPTLTDRLDRILLNPWLGIPVFLAVMWGVFQLTTSVAAPVQDWIDNAFSTVFGGAITGVLGWFSLDDSWLSSFLVDGVLAGVTTVATFIPPMGIMFIALSLLEDSGYLSRAAFVADRAMRSIGLDGRAFLPLLVGFGCNLPALAATRILPDAKQRLLTGLLIPFTSCAARLTVFIMLSTVFFPEHAGTAIFLMYVASILLVVLGGTLLRHTVFRGMRPEPFVLALPAYQRPRLRPMATATWLRLRSFISKAGRVIVATLIVVWLLMAIPIASSASFGEVPVEESAYGRMSAAVAPVFAPAGFDDWHASSALVTGFVAKEVVVGALAQSYAVSEPEDPSLPGDLGTQLRATFDRTSGGHAGAAAAAFMLFVLAYTPCAATVAEQRRLFGWKPALAAVAASLALAWVLAVAVFNVGSLL